MGMERGVNLSLQEETTGLPGRCEHRGPGGHSSASCLLSLRPCGSRDSQMGTGPGPPGRPAVPSTKGRGLVSRQGENPEGPCPLSSAPALGFHWVWTCRGPWQWPWGAVAGWGPSPFGLRCGTRAPGLRPPARPVLLRPHGAAGSQVPRGHQPLRRLTDRNRMNTCAGVPTERRPDPRLSSLVGCSL